MSSVAKAVRSLILGAVDADYPLAIHVPHSFLSIALYREWRAAEGEPMQWLFDLFASFWTHSMGGGVGSLALVEGQTPLTYLTRGDYAWVHCLAYLFTYWSPRDIVYRMLTRPRHPVRLLCVGMDSLDGITSLFGIIDLGFSKHPKNRLVPFMVGAALYNCGSLARWLDARSRGKAEKTFLAQPGSSLTRATLLTLAYCYVRGGRRRDTAVVALSLLEMALELLEEIYGFDAYASLHRPLLAVLRTLQRRLQLGPPGGYSPQICEGASGQGGKAA